MDDSQSHSVSRWIDGLKGGDAQAAQQLWEHYYVRLTELARQRLRGVPNVAADEEDIAQSVFHALYRGAEAGRLSKVNGRDDLWWILLTITRHKAVDHIRREIAEKRGGGQVHNEVDLRGDASDSQAFSLDNLIGDEPTPEFLVIMDEQHRHLLGLLRDDRLRKIANARIEGYTNAEIASDLSVSTRSVERKLQLIRSLWAQEVDDVA